MREVHQRQLLPVIRYEHGGVIHGEHAESGIAGLWYAAGVHAGGKMLMLSRGPSRRRPWRSPGVAAPGQGRVRAWWCPGAVRAENLVHVMWPGGIR